MIVGRELTDVKEADLLQSYPTELQYYGTSLQGTPYLHFYFCYGRRRCSIHLFGRKNKKYYALCVQGYIPEDFIKVVYDWYVIYISYNYYDIVKHFRDCVDDFLQFSLDVE